MKLYSTHSTRAYLRKYWLSISRIRFWLIAILILYTLVGFLVVPWVATTYAVNTVEEDLGRDLQIGAVQTNPFTLDIEVHNLALDDIDGRELIGFKHLYVDVAWSSLFQGTAVIPTARLDDARLREEQFKSGQTRFTRLMAEFQNQPLPRNTANGNIIRPDQSGPTLPIALEGIDCSLDNFIYATEAVSPFRISGQSELGGTFAYQGKVQLLPVLDLSGMLDLDKLALVLGEPAAQRFANIRFGSGSLSAEGELSSGPEDPLIYTGSARIENLDVEERKGAEDVLAWQALVIDEIDFQLGARSLELSVLQLNEPSARVFIAEDRSTNIGQLMVEQPATAKEPENTEPFHLMIGGARLDSGVLDFTDRSLPLPFDAHVQKLRGSVSRLSPGQKAPTRIDLKGQVSEYGEATIGGEMNPWKPISRSQFDLTFTNMDIPDLTPYAVEFTGRRIAEGRMDLDLVYSLDNGQLTANNDIIMRDLLLGERIESKNATNLPLSLAIALLKDSEGVIQFRIPVDGDVNDPQFSYGPAVRQALTDVLRGIISAPFNALARLVEGKPDPEKLATVAFAPGSAEIAPSQQEGLDQLRTALNKRPGLALELPATYAPEADHLALQRKQSRAALVERLNQSGKDIANPSLKAAGTSETLEAMFNDRYPMLVLSNVQERFTTSSKANATGFNATAYRNHLAMEVTDAQPVTQADLKTLARDRATAVRDFLLGSSPAIDPERVKTLATPKVEANDGVVLQIGLAPK